MQNTLENAMRWLELNQLEYWKVSKSRGDKNDKVFETRDEDTLTERKQMFRDVMRLYPSQYFFISGKKSKTQTSGLFEYEFLNGDTVPGATVGSAPQLSGDFVPKSEISGMVAAEIEKYKTEVRLAELEKENKELKKELDESDSAMSRILKKAEPVIGMLMDRFIPAKPAVQIAGLERSQTSETIETSETSETSNIGDVDEALTERASAAIEQWNEADPDFIEVLEFIAQFASSGEKINVFPGVSFDYAQIKELLLKK